jgi:hypothetical protein
MNERGLVKKGEKFRSLAESKKAPLGGALKDFGLGPANLPFMGSGFLFFGEGAELLTETIFCIYIIIQVLHLVQ